VKAETSPMMNSAEYMAHMFFELDGSWENAAQRLAIMYVGVSDAVSSLNAKNKTLEAELKAEKLNRSAWILHKHGLKMDADGTVKEKQPSADVGMDETMWEVMKTTGIVISLRVLRKHGLDLNADGEIVPLADDDAEVST